MVLTCKAVFLLCTAWCFPLYLAFSIDTKTSVVFEGDLSAQFGYRVVQAKWNGVPWLVVSAPLSHNRTGSLFRCSYDTGTCQPMLQTNISGISLGLSLAADETSDSKIIACGPTWERRCGGFDYVNGICYIMSNPDQTVKEIHPTFQECIYGVDAVILYDDSGSIGNPDFAIMKDFILKLMDSVAGMDVQFAVVQFSSEPIINFDFAHYNKTGGQVRNIILSAPHTRGDTHTPTAIRYVVDTIFTPERGMRAHTKKLLIVLTDGESNDKTMTLEEARVAAERKGIIRYAIGVGLPFFNNPKARDELHLIASSSANVFPVKSFDGLHNLQDQLKETIFAIEGTSGASPGASFQLELSQGGFSTLLSSNQVVSGAVGAHGWAGGLEEESLGDPSQTRFLNLSLSSVDLQTSYLGYAVALAHRGSRQFYAAGAPRYQHVGRVIVFERLSKRLTGYIGGTQVGSYFGAELCTVDLNVDGDTDLLLIGSPLYYNGSQGGLVEVCSINNMGRLVHLQTLRGNFGNRLGRFGAALSSLGDVSGDGLVDVAIGAPLEDDNRGAVYIFLGEMDRLKEKHSQRIPAAEHFPKLQFFGQSIQGKLDLSGDALTDLAVGALGNAVLLRSRPIFTIISLLNFSFPLVPMDDPNCANGMVSGVGSRGSVHLCISLKLLTTKWNLGVLKAPVSYDLWIDANQSLPRLTLENEAHSLSETIQVGTERVCITKVIHAQLCLDDTFSPLVVRANFSVQEQPIASARNLRPYYDLGPNLPIEIKVPFKQNCGPDDVCVPDLRVSFNFSGSKGLKLSPNFILNITLKLENVGEMANNSELSFHYSPVVSFRRASVLQSNWRLSPTCKMHGSQGNASGNASVYHSSCRFNPPVLKGGTQAFLQLSFRSSSGNWSNNFVYFTIQAHSQNEKDTLSDNEATEQLPVLRPVDIILERLPSTKHLNFSTEVSEKKILTHAYKVKKLDTNVIPVNVTFELPSQIELGFIWNLSSHPNDKYACTEWESRLMGIQDKGLKEPITLGSQSLYLRSEASLMVDETKFFLSEPEEFQYKQINTEVELISPFNSIPIIAGSVIGGILLLAIVAAILYKVGFFKRKHVPQMDTNPAGAAAAAPN
ncbi:integrin alpha-X-like isoform X2 [Tiliqua scincoides]|uniref:integrin alpha-X-like isoform X2 n=1 Tax=Tiliqua scincoides TaxID=71010 RepID=UPI0034617D51